MLNPQKIEILLDPSVRPLSHLLQGQLVLDPLYCPGDRGRDLLDAPLDGGLEEGDVTLPFGSPLHGLARDALVGAGEEHVKGGEGGDAGAAKGDDL